MAVTRITPEEIEQMILLYDKLGTYAAVAREIGRSASSVSKYIKLAKRLVGSHPVLMRYLKEALCHSWLVDFDPLLMRKTFRHISMHSFEFKMYFGNKKF